MPRHGEQVSPAHAALSVTEKSLSGLTVTRVSRSYDCDCSETGFEGDHCETDVPECASNPCQHGGRCLEQVKGYACVCWPGKTTAKVSRCQGAPLRLEGSGAGLGGYPDRLFLTERIKVSQSSSA